MQAIIQTRYGLPADVELREVPTPRPAHDQVLVEVRASAVNDWEWALVRGRPLYIRAFGGLFSPGSRILGSDVAGRVEAVGSAVTRFAPGDEVYGDLSESGFGAFATYVCAPEGALVRKPRNLTYEQAAAIPHAGMLAQQALHDIAGIDRARTLLINGAGGGVGPIALQLARRHGVEITGVDAPSKQEFLRSIGCDHVIDYTRTDFTRAGRAYDVILDVKTNRSPFAYARALGPDGTYVTVGGATPRLIQCLVWRRWIARTRRRHIRILGLKPNQGLDEMTTRVEAGEVAPHIDSVYPLSQVADALVRFGASSHTGKIVVRP